MNKKTFLLILYSTFLILNLSAQPPFKTGVNFPMRNPETTSIQEFFKRLSETKTPVTRQVTFADVFWGSVESPNDSFDFTNQDSAFLNDHNIHVIGTLYSMMGELDTFGIQVPWKACTNPDTCFWDIARDSNDTKDYIKTIVNRYKDRTKYWELANEIETRSKPTSLPITDLINFFKYNTQWIKNNDSTAKTLLPGLVGTYGLPLNSKYAWLKLFLLSGGGDVVDIMNYHDYNSWWTLPAHFDSIRDILTQFGYSDKPIWITECSVSSDTVSNITPNYSSEDEQAADVWRRPSVLWSRGAEVVFWHCLWSSDYQSEWSHFGLLNDKGEKKKSFYAYQLLIDEVADFDSIELISSGNIVDNNDNGGDGIWAVKFMVDGKKKWLLWSPDNQVYSFPRSWLDNSDVVNVTHVVPDDVLFNGDSAEFNIYTKVCTSDSTQFQLTSLPILLEEGTATSMEKFIEASNEIKVFPNPTNSAVNIQFDLQDEGKLKLTIYNLQGVLLISEELPDIPLTHPIDLSHLLNGVYVLKIESDSQMVVKKVLLQK